MIRATWCVWLGLSLLAAATHGQDEGGPAADTRGYLGVSIAPIDEAAIKRVQKAISTLPLGEKEKKANEKAWAAMKPGLMVTAVLKDGPADKAGMKFGDLILGVGDADVGSDLKELQAALSGTKVGKKVQVRYARFDDDGNMMNGEATLTPVSKAKVEKLKPIENPLSGLLGGQTSGGSKPAPKDRFNETFEKATADETPAGWKPRRNGEGSPVEWKVIEDAKGKGGKQVLAVVEPANGPDTMNLLIHEEVKFEKNMYIRARIRAVDGENAMGGGLVFGYKNKDNFYSVVLDHKNQEIALYKVVDGQRTKLASKPAALKKRVWYQLQAERVTTRILVRFEGNLFLDARDESLVGGKAGVVALGDAVTWFDDVMAEPPLKPMGGR